MPYYERPEWWPSLVEELEAFRGGIFQRDSISLDFDFRGGVVHWRDFWEYYIRKCSRGPHVPQDRLTEDDFEEWSIDGTTGRANQVLWQFPAFLGVVDNYKFDKALLGALLDAVIRGEKVYREVFKPLPDVTERIGFRRELYTFIKRIAATIFHRIAPEPAFPILQHISNTAAEFTLVMMNEIGRLDFRATTEAETELNLPRDKKIVREYFAVLDDKRIPQVSEDGRLLAGLNQELLRWHLNEPQSPVLALAQCFAFTKRGKDFPRFRDNVKLGAAKVGTIGHLARDNGIGHRDVAEVAMSITALAVFDWVFREDERRRMKNFHPTLTAPVLEVYQYEPLAKRQRVLEDLEDSELLYTVDPDGFGTEGMRPQSEASEEYRSLDRKLDVYSTPKVMRIESEWWVIEWYQCSRMTSQTVIQNSIT